MLKVIVSNLSVKLTCHIKQKGEYSNISQVVTTQEKNLIQKFILKQLKFACAYLKKKKKNDSVFGNSILWSAEMTNCLVGIRHGKCGRRGKP